MNILVTGGAGYIGSSTVNLLIEKGHNVIIIDNLSKGKQDLINLKSRFYPIDLIDKEKLSFIFKEHKIDSVIHFASYKAAEESMKEVVKYSDNILGIINLLNCMVENKVNKIIFSSSAAVYGMSKEKIVNEETSTNPINFYGFAKLKCEELIKWYHKVYGMNYISLRYFNVAGDSGLNYVDPLAKNIFPILMEVIEGRREILKIFGKDYDTPDGTCVRDYIDINDLVDAHILALDSDYNGMINLGTGRGYSVKELVDKFIEVTNEKINYKYDERRDGDPAFLVASNSKARDILGWFPKRNLNEMIKSTYNSYKNNGLI